MGTLLKTISEKICFGILVLTLAIIPSVFKTQTAKAAIIDTVLAKDASNLPTSLDLDARKKILNKVLDTTQTEVEGLKNKLNGIDLDDDWNIIRDGFLSNLADFKSYNESFSKKVNSDTITTEEIKNLAKDMIDWREKNYTPKLKEITNMTFIFDEESLLKIAQGRLDKISSDIKKLSKQNYINTNKLKTLLPKAEKSLNKSTSYQNEAKDLFIKSFADFIKAKNENASSTEKEAAIIIPADEKQETPIEIQDSIRNLLKNSLTEIKNTYDIFFQMNNEIKKYL
jgi:hypothetical protein